jgi:hypothetical protein
MWLSSRLAPILTARLRLTAYLLLTSAAQQERDPPWCVPTSDLHKKGGVDASAWRYRTAEYDCNSGAKAVRVEDGVMALDFLVEGLLVTTCRTEWTQARQFDPVIAVRREYFQFATGEAVFSERIEGGLRELALLDYWRRLPRVAYWCRGFVGPSEDWSGRNLVERTTGDGIVHARLATDDGIVEAEFDAGNDNALVTFRNARHDGGATTVWFRYSTMGVLVEVTFERRSGAGCVQEAAVLSRIAIEDIGVAHAQRVSSGTQVVDLRLKRQTTRGRRLDRDTNVQELLRVALEDDGELSEASPVATQDSSARSYAWKVLVAVSLGLAVVALIWVLCRRN